MVPYKAMYLTSISLIVFAIFSQRTSGEIWMESPTDNQFIALERRETPCPAKLKPVSELTEKFILSTRSWYIPMASFHYYASWGEMIKNGSLSYDEITNMCIRYAATLPFKPNGIYFGIIGAFRNALAQTCQQTGYLTQTCRPKVTVDTFGKIDNTVDVVVQSDNKSWFLMMRCVDYDNKDWAVFTTNQTVLTPTMKHRILEILAKKFGFDKKYAVVQKYDMCSSSNTRYYNS